MTNLTTPTIHLNGTPRQHLGVALEEAAAAVFRASERVAWTAPNARDYYPQGPLAWQQAVREHDSRLQRLRTVYDELQQLREAIES